MSESKTCFIYNTTKHEERKVSTSSKVRYEENQKMKYGGWRKRGQKQEQAKFFSLFLLFITEKITQYDYEFSEILF